MTTQITVKPFSFVALKDYFGDFLFILPAVAIFGVFYVYPFYSIFNLSLYDWNGISAAKTFVGLDNFKMLLQDERWWQSMGNAAFITLIALTFQNVLAFALALACNRKIHLKGFYRVVFFIPPILSEVVVGFVWKWILNADMQANEHVGLLNYCLSALGLNHLVHNWLSDPSTALACIAIVHSWKGFGWGFVMLLAGLQTIEPEIYEAAEVDGAGAWSTFWHVTIPLMMPVISVVIVLTILGAMQSFVLILSMVSQGLTDHTSVPLTRILSAMIKTGEFGYACAQGVSFGIILIFVAFVLKKFSDWMVKAK